LNSFLYVCHIYSCGLLDEAKCERLLFTEVKYGLGSIRLNKFYQINDDRFLYVQSNYFETFIVNFNLFFLFTFNLEF